MEKKPDDIELLEKKIARLQQENSFAKGKGNEAEAVRASRIGFRIGAELVAAVVVGVALGYLFDGIFGTKPWLMVVFLFFGGAAGILNVYRFVKNENKI